MHALKSITAILLLTAYAVSGTSALPALTLMLADLDGSHFVKVFQSSSGTEVLLDHGNEFTPQVGDHRSCLARVVASLSRRTDEGSHLYSSKRLRTVVANDTVDAQRQVKKSAEVNLRATFDLVVSLQETFSVALSAKSQATLQQAPKSEKGWKLETVQLLI